MQSAPTTDVEPGALVGAPGLARWFFAPVPARRVDLVRAFTFGYAAAWLVLRAPYVWDVASLPDRRFEPIGVLGWMSSPPHRSVVVVLWVVAAVAAASASAGRALRLSAPVAAATMLLIATFTSSFGQTFHSEHLVVIHLGILAVAAVIADPTPNGVDELVVQRRSGWPLNLMMSVVAVAYVVSGIAKVRLGGTDWITGEDLRSWVAVDNLRKLMLDDPYSKFGGWLVGVAWVWMPIALATLAIEIGAPIALARGRLRLVWVAAAWSFHVGVLVIMAISFPYQLTGVAYLAFIDVERVESRIRVRRARAADARPTAARPGMARQIGRHICRPI